MIDVQQARSLDSPVARKPSCTQLQTWEAPDLATNWIGGRAAGGWRGCPCPRGHVAQQSDSAPKFSTDLAPGHSQTCRKGPWGLRSCDQG